MLDEATRTAILKLHEQDHGSRSIARALRVSRDAVRRVIASDSATVPPLEQRRPGHWIACWHADRLLQGAA